MTVLVKHWRLHDLTRQCVDSLLAYTPEMNELIVVDGSALEDCGPYSFHPGVIHWEPIDAPLIESFNVAILNYARNSDAWACLNNDVIVTPGWLQGMIDTLAANTRIGIVAPLYDDPGGGALSALGPQGPLGQYRIVSHVDNTAWMFTAALVNKIGLPDPAFRGAGWGANLDYCYRARRAGFLVAISQGSFIHHGGAVTYGVDPNYRKMAEAARDEVLRRKYGNPAVVW